MLIKIFNKNQKKEIENKLREQFGILEIPGEILQRGKERLFLYQGNLSPRMIENLDRGRLNIERVGVYFGKIVENIGEIRLSIEGTQLLKDQIKKNIFELNEEQMEEWMKGRELLIKTGKKGILIMKYEKDFLGCGKASEEKITNFIPKNRRLKEKQ